MGSLKQKILRTPRTWTDIFPIACLLGFLFTLCGMLIAYLPRFYYICKLFTSDQDTLDQMASYTDFTGIWVLAIAVFLIFKNNRPLIKVVLPDNKKKILLGILAGALIGFVLNGTAILGAFLMGNIKLSYSGFKILPLIGFLIFIPIQSGAEELALRCYVYQKLRRRYNNPLVAIIGNSLLFMSFHLSNNGVNIACLFQLFEVGLFFSLIIYYYDNFWVVAAAHSAWNFTQNITFGLLNSGIPSACSIFKLDEASNGFFYDTGFGVEGAWGTDILMAIAIIVIILMNRGKGERNDLWAHWEKHTRKKKISDAKPAVETTGN